MAHNDDGLVHGASANLRRLGTTLALVLPRVAGREADIVLAEVQQLVAERFGIEHRTIQIESGDAECGAYGTHRQLGPT